MTQYFKTLDIVLDVEKKKEQVSLFKKLVNSLCTRKKRPTTTALENIRKMYKTLKHEEVYPHSAISIKNLNFEFEILNALDASRSISANKLNLMRDFERLVELLSTFVEEPKEDTYEIEITFERPKPKKVKKVTTYEKITILERWVKIGYKMYRRQFNPWTGESYIVVDGDVYNIKSDRYGREYLA